MMSEREERAIDVQPLIEISRSARSKEGFNIFDYIWLYKMPHLTQDQLSGFNRYKYAAIDTSPLSKYVMHPFWNWGVTFFPTWVAPNVMTFAGWILLAIDFGLMSHYDWSFTAANGDTCSIPSWVWFLVAWNHFWSHQLDGMDGKQARRTGSGGPLGELMDHGIDSNCIWMLPMTLLSAIGSDPATGGIDLHYTIILLIFICFSFYVAHWEKYSTGILYLPWMFDIAQLTVVALFIIVGIMTPDGLKTFCATHLIPFNHILYIGIPLGASASLFMSCLNIYCSIKDGTCKTKSFGAMMKPWASYIIYNTLFLIFSFSCPDTMITHTRIFALAYGATFSNIVCRLMINQMSDSEVDLIMPPIIPLALCTFLAAVCRIDAGMVITIYSIFAMAAFVHYCYVIVNELCDHLHICAFSITQKR